MSYKTHYLYVVDLYISGLFLSAVNHILSEGKQTNVTQIQKSTAKSENSQQSIWQNRPLITKPFPRSERQMEVLSAEMISCHYTLARGWELQIPTAAAWISARALLGTVSSRHQRNQQKTRLWEKTLAAFPLMIFYRYYIQQRIGFFMPSGIIWHPYPVEIQHV